MSGQTTPPGVKPPILPREAVNWTWSLTIGQSSSADAEGLRQRQKEINRYIEQIRKDTKDQNADRRDLRFIDGVHAAINSCVRTLHIIIRGRDTNFKEVDKLKDVYIARAEDIATFSGNLQSLSGRIASITIGGTSVTAIVAYYFPTLPTFFLPLILTAAGAASFGIHEAVVKPWQRRQNEKASIENDYRRNLYYQQYVERSKDALAALLTEILDLYREVYGQAYDPIIDEPGKKEEYIVALLKPLEFGEYTCPCIHECYADGVILKRKYFLERWQTCESGEGYDQCDEYKTRKCKKG